MTKRIKNQRVAIAHRLATFGYITTEEAINDKMTTKLSTRIGEIENNTGLEILRERVSWGDTHGTRYYIEAYHEKFLRELAESGLV